MATEDKRIDQLPAVTVLSSDSLLVLQQNGQALYMTVKQLLDYIQNNVNVGDAVKFVSQSLTDSQKQQARLNIGAAAIGDGSGGTLEGAVLYISQSLTEEQRKQARKNIRCGSMGDVSDACTATGINSHAEGFCTTAKGNYSHAEGYYCAAEESSGHAEGHTTTASGQGSHAEGYNTKAKGSFSHAEGRGTIARGGQQHVEGEYNVEDTTNMGEGPGWNRFKYVHIVGNGTSDNDRSNAHTLDWEGNAWYAGSVEGTALILKSPGDKRFQITVDDSGLLTATEIM